MTRAILSLLAALVAAGCGDSATATSPSSTSTSSTEYFTGTLSPTTSQFYSFSVTTAGAVLVTLASTSTSRIGAAGTAPLDVGVGTPSGFGCALTESVQVSPGDSMPSCRALVARPGSTA